VEWIRLPDVQEYEQWFTTGAVKLMTVAPELPGALELIRRGVRRGVRFSVGHSAASYGEVVNAVGHGLDQSTHTFNGMRGIHHREPGVVGAVLADERIYAEMIADGVHLHPAVVKMLAHVKGIQKTILVTDAIRATGLTDGEYDLGGQTVIVDQGVARTGKGSLAGSTLTLDAAVRNTIRFTGLSLQEAVAMATATPATALGLYGLKGVLQPGADADLALLDSQLNVRATLVRGEIVYDARR
jgi:N-acetylglucosamine-6-phosphate deacetylase